MIRINLLPHREEKRRARRQQFYALLGLITILAGLIWFLGYSIIQRQITAQAEKNEFIKSETAVLDKEIEEIKKLKTQIDALLARKRVIEDLQGNRTETVHLFNQLARQVPDGVYIKSLKQTGNKLAIAGYAQSSARIATLMNNLDDSSLFENSQQKLDIKAETVSGKRLNAFSLETYITRQSAKPAAGKK